MRCLSLLAWVTEDAVVQFFEKKRKGSPEGNTGCNQVRTMERAQAVCGKKRHTCEYVQGEKHRTLWYDIRKCLEVGISIK